MLEQQNEENALDSLNEAVPGLEEMMEQLFGGSCEQHPWQGTDHSEREDRLGDAAENYTDAQVEAKRVKFEALDDDATERTMRYVEAMQDLGAVAAGHLPVGDIRLLAQQVGDIMSNFLDLHYAGPEDKREETQESDTQ